MGGKAIDETYHTRNRTEKIQKKLAMEESGRSLWTFPTFSAPGLKAELRAAASSSGPSRGSGHAPDGNAEIRFHRA